MTKLLETAFERAKASPPAEQDNIAKAVLGMLEGDAVWDDLLASDRSQSWLEEQAAKVEAQILAGNSFEIDPSSRAE